MAGLEKKLMYKEVKSKIEGKNVFFARFEKLGVEHLTRFRMNLSKINGKAIVVKNSIARLICKDLGMDAAVPSIDGQMMLIASEKEPQKISKEIMAFNKEQEMFSVQGVFIDGGFQPKSYIADLATLPSREQLIASLLGGMKAPITNFVFCLNGVMKNLAVVLNEISKKKSENQ